MRKHRRRGSRRITLRNHRHRVVVHERINLIPVRFRGRRR